VCACSGRIRGHRWCRACSLLSCACTRDDGEVDARSPMGEAGSQRTHINAGMRKTTHSSRKATVYRPPRHPEKLHPHFFSPYLSEIDIRLCEYFSPLQVDAAPTVVASRAAVGIFLGNRRPRASHAPHGANPNLKAAHAGASTRNPQHLQPKVSTFICREAVLLFPTRFLHSSTLQVPTRFAP
jgi:hypothetical protein